MESIFHTINNLYGVTVESSEKVDKGFLSENHVLFDRSADKKYFLKRYRFDDEKRIEEIHIAKRYFADHGIPIILPLPTKEGNTFFLFDGGYFALFPFIEGRHMDRGEFTDSAIISMGETLAKIHLAGKDAKLPIDKSFTVWDKEKMLEKKELLVATIKDRETLSEFDQLALKDLELRGSIIASNELTFESMGFHSDHLIHGDYHAGNIFFDEHDRVSHVFDLEKSIYSPRMFELFRSATFMFCGNAFDAVGFAHARLYIDSYLKVYPASLEELRLGLRLFFLRFVHGFWVQNEHYLKGNIRVDHFLPQDYQRIQYFSEHWQEIEDALINE